MTDRLVAIHLHGPLADRFGSPHHLAVLTPREAVQAIDANHPGFLAAFAEHNRYAIYADGDWRDGDAAAALPVSREMHFCPMIEGEAPVGIALVGLLVPSIAGTVTATIIGSLLVTGLLIGISLLFKPKAPGAGEAEAREEGFAFSGPENVTGQGVAVPLIYGRVYAGSVVISAGQDVSQLYATGPNAGKPIPPSPPSFMAKMTAPRRKFNQPRAQEPPPLDRSLEGAGTDHLRQPPEEGWPPIIQDPVYGWRPEGWVPASIQWVAEEQDESRKQVMVWQPDYETADGTYNWNMVRGFYLTEVPNEWEDEEGVLVPGVISDIHPEEEEWIAGRHMENEVEAPEP